MDPGRSSATFAGMPHTCHTLRCQKATRSWEKMKARPARTGPRTGPDEAAACGGCEGSQAGAGGELPGLRPPAATLPPKRPRSNQPGMEPPRRPEPTTRGGARGASPPPPKEAAGRRRRRRTVTGETGAAGASETAARAAGSRSPPTPSPAARGFSRQPPPGTAREGDAREGAAARGG